MKKLCALIIVVFSSFLISATAYFAYKINTTWYVSSSSLITDHGNATKSNSLAWTLARAGSRGDIVINDGNYSIGTNISVGSGIYISARPGTRITANSPRKFIFQNGSRFSAGVYKIFYGDGNVTFADGQEIIYADWFGGANDGVSDDSADVQQAIDSIPPLGSKLVFSNKTWIFNASITNPHYGEVVGGGMYGNCWYPYNDDLPILTIGGNTAATRIYGSKTSNFHMCSKPVGGVSGFTSKKGLWMRNGSYNDFTNFWIANFAREGLQIIEDGSSGGYEVSSSNNYRNFVISVGPNIGGVAGYAIYNGVGTGANQWSTTSNFSNFTLWSASYGNEGSLIYNPCQQGFQGGFLELDSNATEPYYAVRFPTGSCAGVFNDISIETARTGANTAPFIKNDIDNVPDVAYMTGMWRALGGTYVSADGSSYGIGYGNSKRSFNNPSVAAYDIRAVQAAIGGILGFFQGMDEVDPYTGSWTRRITVGDNDTTKEMNVYNEIGPLWIWTKDGVTFYDYTTSLPKAVINSVGMFVGGTGGTRTYLLGSDSGGGLYITGYHSPSPGTYTLGTVVGSDGDNSTSITANAVGGTIRTSVNISGSVTQVGGWDSQKIMYQSQTYQPATSTTACTKGTSSWYDDGTYFYLYFCYATNNWTLVTKVGHGFVTPVSSDWAVKATTYTAVAGDKILANTTSGGFTITLPAVPAVGNEIQIADGNGTFSTNNLTVSPNGNKILGSASNLTLNLANSLVRLVYYNAAKGWQVY